MKRRFLLSLLIGGACLWLALRKVHWAGVAASFRQADYTLLPVFVAAHLAGMLVRTIRWRLILEPLKRTGFGSVLSAASIGLMANFLFPARAGEVVKAYVIGRREGVSKSAAFATIILERLFDGFAILVFLGLAPFFLEVAAGRGEAMAGLRLAGGVALAAYAFILAVLFGFYRWHDAFMRLTERLCRPLPGGLAETARKLVCHFGRGLDMLGSPLAVATVMGWSVLLWTVLGVGNWAVLRAFGLELPLYTGLFLVVAQSFGVMVPSPGFVGAFQYAHVLGLSILGVSREVSLSVGLLIHGLLFLIHIALGVGFLWAEGLDLGRVRRGEDRVGAGPGAEA